jgi:hypothetical protein
MTILNILWTFRTFFVHLVHFSLFGYHVPRKIWQPRFRSVSSPSLQLSCNAMKWSKKFRHFDEVIGQRCTRMRSKRLQSRRVARWYIFKPKIPNLGKFWRALEWKCLVYSMAIWKKNYGHLVYFTYGHLEKNYGHLVYFRVIWYISPILVCCPQKNLATLLQCRIRKRRFDGQSSVF